MQSSALNVYGVLTMIFTKISLHVPVWIRHYIQPYTPLPSDI